MSTFYSRNSTPSRIDRSLCILVVVLISNCVSSAHAQFAQPIQLSADVTIDQVDPATLSSLERADRFFAENEASDGLDALRRAIDSEGEKLLPARKTDVEKHFRVFRPLRFEGQRRLCDLAKQSPAALALYRSQTNAVVKRLVAQATAQHDERLLERAVQNHFAAVSGDNAALLAGDAALRRGDILTARSMWQRLHPGLVVGEAAAKDIGVRPGIAWYYAVRGKDVDSIWETIRPHIETTDVSGAFPDSDIPIAEVRARLVLASLIEGNSKRATWELALFRKLHSDVQGKLAGRSGELTTLLEQFGEQSKAWTSKPQTQEWQTLAGNPARNQVGVPLLEVSEKAAWQVDLPRLVGDKDICGAGRFRVAEDHRGLLSYFPIAVNDLVIDCDGRSIKAHQAFGGELAWEVLLRPEGTPETITNAQVGVPRYTLTHAEGMIAVTLPSASVPQRRAATVRAEQLSRVVVIDIATRRNILDLVASDATEVFEGSPLVDHGRIYVSLRKHSEVRPQTFVACYEISSGRKAWQREIVSADWLDQGDRAAFANSLLTLDHETLFYNSNLGAIASMAARDGSINWVMCYPRVEGFPAAKPERSERHFFRDLTPCLVHQGQIVCAPADSDRIFSLDAASGEVLWTLPPGDAVDAIHLLGAEDKYLAVSGDYLYWIDLEIGQVVTQFPAALPMGPGLALPGKRGWGRGLLVGNRIAFPTQNAVYLFDISPKAVPPLFEPTLVETIDLRARMSGGGNMLLSHDRLVIATAEKLMAFEVKPKK